MNMQTKEIYSEVYSILNLLGEDYIKKLPTDLFNMIEEERKQDYNPQYDLKNFEGQSIKRASLSMIALFHLNYWCKSDDEKNNLKQIFRKNQEKYQTEIREKYNPDNIFKNKKENIDNDSLNEVDLIEYKETIFKKILKKIKKILHII